MGAFYWTKFRLNFRKFHVPNGTVLWLRLHRPDPSHRAFSYCSCKKYTKVRYWEIWGEQKCGTEEIWGEQFGQMEKDISFRPTKMTRRVKVDHAASNSGRTKPKWSIPMDVPTEIFGILGWMERAHWITGNAFRISLHPIGTIGDGFLNFSIMARSQSW